METYWEDESLDVPVPKIFKQYELVMQVKLLGMDADRTNIINIGIGGQKSAPIEYGYRNPSIWLKEKSHTLRFATALDNNADYEFDYELDTPDKWTHYESL